jgi:hypothetical protein
VSALVALLGLPVSSFAQDAIFIGIEPTGGERFPGEIFIVAIVAQTGTQAVDGIETYVAFDPTRIQVIGEDGDAAAAIEPGDTLDLVLVNQVDPESGLIHFAAGKFFEPLPSGTFALARLTATALTPIEAGEAVFWLSQNLEQQSLATLNGTKLPLASAAGL